MVTGFLLVACNVQCMLSVKVNVRVKKQSSLQSLVDTGALDGILGSRSVKKLANDSTLTESQKTEQEQQGSVTPRSLGMALEEAFVQREIIRMAAILNQCENSLASIKRLEAENKQIREILAVDQDEHTCCCVS